MSSRYEITFANIRQFLLGDIALSVVASLLSLLVVCWISRPISNLFAVSGLWLGQAFVGSLAGWFIFGLWKMEYRHMVFHPRGRLLCCVVLKEAVTTFFLLIGIIGLPSLQSCVLAVILDTMFTTSLLFLSRYVMFIREQRDHSHEKNLCHRTAIVLGTNDEAVSLADEAERVGRYEIVGFLTTETALDGTSIGGRPVYSFKDAYDLNTLLWHLCGIDNILIPREWNSAFRGAVKTRESITFHEESWKKYLMMLNSERKS